MTPDLIVLCLVLGVLQTVVVVVIWRKRVAFQRAEYIRHSPLPQGLYERLCKRRPDLSQKDCQLVGQALRQFFLAHLTSGRQFVSMPSQLADDLWHEFILYTKHYENFCGKAFGRFLHHTPAVVLGSARDANAGLRRCWWYACREENINPRRPSRLPLLFALDTKFGIADGFHYVADCGSVRNVHDRGIGVIYCGGDFADASFAGGTQGFGETSSTGWFGGSGEGAVTAGAGGGGSSGGSGCDGGNSSDSGGGSSDSGGGSSGCGGGGCGGGGGD